MSQDNQDIPDKPVESTEIVVDDNMGSSIDFTTTAPEEDNIVDKIYEAVPDNRKMHVTKDFINRVLVCSEDETERKAMIDNFITHKNILNSSHHTLDEYLDAVKYCSLIEAGVNKHEVFATVFPARSAKMFADGLNKSQRASKICNYECGKLVTNLMDQIHTPIRIMFKSMFRENLQNLHDIAMPDASVTFKQIPARDRVAASSKILEILRPNDDEVSTAFVEATKSGTSILNTLKEHMNKMSNQIHGDIVDGNVSPKNAAARDIVNRLGTAQADSDELVYDSATNTYHKKDDAPRDKLEVGK